MTQVPHSGYSHQAPCGCRCHVFAQGIETPSGGPTVANPPDRPSATKLDGSFGGPAPHANSPAGWYRTMDRGFAVEHFRFPAHPRRDDRWTAHDGSVWVYGLTGTEWWELAEYAPEQDSAARITELEAELQTSREMYTSARERAAELRTELEAKRSQHAETLAYLERTYAVIERDTAAHQQLIRRLWKSRRFWQGKAPEGLAVGYISHCIGHPGMEFDAEGEPMWDTVTTELHATEAAAREQLGLARLGMPEGDWRVYALTDITERGEE